MLGKLFHWLFIFWKPYIYTDTPMNVCDRSAIYIYYDFSSSIPQKFHEILVYCYEYKQTFEGEKNRRKKEKSNTQPNGVTTPIHISKQCYPMLNTWIWLEFFFSFFCMYIYLNNKTLCVYDSVPIPLKYLDINLRSDFTVVVLRVAQKPFVKLYIQFSYSIDFKLFNTLNTFVKFIVNLIWSKSANPAAKFCR